MSGLMVMIYNNHTDNYPLMTFLQYHVLNFKTSDLRPEQIAANPALADLEGRSISLRVLYYVPFQFWYFTHSFRNISLLVLQWEA
mgnify:CR=1 FL=1